MKFLEEIINSADNINNDNLFRKIIELNSEDLLRAYTIVIDNNNTFRRIKHSSWKRLYPKINIDENNYQRPDKSPFYDQYFLNDNLRKRAQESYKLFKEDKIKKFSQNYFFENESTIRVVRNTYVKIGKQKNKFIYLVVTELLDDNELNSILQYEAETTGNFCSAIVKLIDNKFEFMSFSSNFYQLLNINTNENIKTPGFFGNYVSEFLIEKDREIYNDAVKKTLNLQKGEHFELDLGINVNNLIKQLHLQISNINYTVKNNIFSIVIKDVTKDHFYKMQLEHLAKTDALTGLYNRHELHCADISNITYLVFIDLNKLKHINDTYGHLMGDKALVHASHIAKHLFKDDGMLYRYAGDEFVLLTSKSHERVKHIVKRINEYKFNLVTEDKEVINFSASAGYAKITKGSQLSKIIKIADKHMYDNKIQSN